MVEIADALRSLFSATIQSEEESYTIEVPTSEVNHDAIHPDKTYRIAVFKGPETTSRPGQQASDTAESHTVQQRTPAEPPVKEGEVRDVTIETIGDQGDGIAKVDRGYVVIVPEAQPGDKPTIEIKQVQENVAFATVVDSDPRTL